MQQNANISMQETLVVQTIPLHTAISQTDLGLNQQQKFSCQAPVKTQLQSKEFSLAPPAIRTAIRSPFPKCCSLCLATNGKIVLLIFNETFTDHPTLLISKRTRLQYTADTKYYI